MKHQDIKYLDMEGIKNDPWVKLISSAKTSNELALLIVNRFVYPDITGPVLLYGQDHTEREIEADIIFDMVAYNIIDYHLLNDAMKIIMEKVISKNISVNNNFLDNAFFLIEDLCLENSSKEMYQWIIDNYTFAISQNPNNRFTFLNALNAYAFSQKKEIGALIMWKGLWEQPDSQWWSAAFLGLRYYDLNIALGELSKFVDRKCFDAPKIIMNLYRNSDKVKFENQLKKAIKCEEKWAGHAINMLAAKMKFAEKQNLLNSLL